MTTATPSASERLRGVMPAWKVKLVGVVVVAMAGFGAMWWFAPESGVVAGQAGVGGTGIEARGFTGGGGGAATGGEAVVVEPSMREKVGAWGLRLGASFLLMLAVGMVLRAFVKILATLVILTGLVVGGLTYLGMRGEDLEKSKAQVEAGVGWAERQVKRLGDSARQAVPSTLAGLAGFAAGFKRR